MIENMTEDRLRAPLSPSAEAIVAVVLHKFGPVFPTERPKEFAKACEQVAEAVQAYLNADPRLRALVAALRPFAAEVEKLDSRWEGDCPDDLRLDEEGDSELTVGDLRRARAALAALEMGDK
jgi:hypothetical protein